MMYKLLVIYSFVNLSLGSTFCARTERKKCPQKDDEKIPAYILYILGFLSILLVLVLIALIYVLVKSKFLKRNHTSPSTEKLEVGVQCLTCQKKNKGTIFLEKNNSDLRNENDITQTLRRQDSELTIANDFNTLQSPKKSGVSGNISPRIIKGVGKDLPYILPEQMSQICKEVLKRAKTDSANSLQNIHNIINESKPKEDMVSKCASTPALDLYDTLTTPAKSTNIQTQKTKNTAAESTVSRIINIDEGIASSSKSGDDNSDPDFDIYDFPKEPNNLYDMLPPEKKTKVENVSGYATPCFENQPPSKNVKLKEEKLNYAVIKDVSLEQNPVKSKDTDNTINVLEDYEYDNPKNAAQKDQMYINANVVEMPKM